MPFYQKRGNIPNKRHTIFRKENGELHHEQLFGTVGFDGMSSLLYHLQPPTIVKDFIDAKDIRPKIASEHQLQMKSFEVYKIKQKDDFLESRIPILVNSDCEIILSRPKKSLKNYFYKNADCDEVIFIHEGSGKLRTLLGDIDFKYGDKLFTDGKTRDKVYGTIE